jgi:hypothetical protein
MCDRDVIQYFKKSRVLKSETKNLDHLTSVIMSKHIVISNVKVKQSHYRPEQAQRVPIS